jgi:hypothetical protein
MVVDTNVADTVDEPSEHYEAENSSQQTIDVDVVEILEEPTFLEVVSISEQHGWQQYVEHNVVVEGHLTIT